MYRVLTGSGVSARAMLTKARNVKAAIFMLILVAWWLADWADLCGEVCGVCQAIPHYFILLDMHDTHGDIY